MQDSEDKKEEVVQMGGEADVSKRVYEVGYLLVPTVTEEDLPAIYGNLKELVSTVDGMVIADEMPKPMELAYSMSKVVKNVKNKYDTAYFGWTKFEAVPEKVAEVKKKLENDPNFLRFLIIKTTRENSTAGRRFTQRDGKRRVTSHKTREEDAQPIDKEAVDKEIEAMVSE